MNKLSRLGPGFLVLVWDPMKGRYRFGKVMFLLGGPALDRDDDFTGAPFIVLPPITDLSRVEVDLGECEHFTYILEVPFGEVTRKDKLGLLLRLIGSMREFKYVRWFYSSAFSHLVEEEGLVEDFLDGTKGKDIISEHTRIDSKEYPYHCVSLSVVPVSRDGVALVINENKEYEEGGEKMEEEYTWCDGYLYSFPCVYSIKGGVVEVSKPPTRALSSEECALVRKSRRDGVDVRVKGVGT